MGTIALGYDSICYEMGTIAFVMKWVRWLLYMVIGYDMGTIALIMKWVR